MAWTVRVGVSTRLMPAGWLGSQGAQDQNHLRGHGMRCEGSVPRPVGQIHGGRHANGERAGLWNGVDPSGSGLEGDDEGGQPVR